MKWIAIILLCIASAVLYGVVHDQVTARICVEYFTIGHPPVFPMSDPTLLGLGWGIIATWWVGLILGIPLASICRLGPWPKLEPHELIRPLLWLFGCAFALAIVAGFAGWIAVSNGWVLLVGAMAHRVPADRHIPFIADLWAHTASYLAGFVGGIVIMVWALRERLGNRSSTNDNADHS